MKKLITPIIIVACSIVIILLSLDKCNEAPAIEPNNTEHFNKIEELKNKLSVLSVLNDSLGKSYKEALNRKDSVRIVIKNKYIQVFDTITQSTIDCLPKIYVDSLIFAQDSTDKICEQNILIKDKIIENLTIQNNVKDTIINNNKDEIKRQKKGKIKAFFVGVGVGAFIRSLF